MTMRPMTSALLGAGLLFLIAQSSLAQGRGRGRPEPVAKVGATAPDFTLKTVDGKSKFQLSSFKNKKPVALVFGSYT